MEQIKEDDEVYDDEELSDKPLVLEVVPGASENGVMSAYRNPEEYHDTGIEEAVTAIVEEKVEDGDLDERKKAEEIQELLGSGEIDPGSSVSTLEDAAYEASVETTAEEEDVLHYKVSVIQPQEGGNSF